MKIYKCIIIEDEPLAAEVLSDYINNIPFLECNNICTDAIQALELLKENHFDLIFLDLHLPRIKGLDFLRSLKDPPQVIITTAHREFAVEGFELNVVDYLLKPISFNRFLTAVNKLNTTFEKTPSTSGNNTNSEQEYIFINIRKKRVKLILDDIIYIESKKEYINIVSKSQTHITKFQLSEFENLIDKKRFIRIHRCFIVSISKVKSFEATEIDLGEIQLPIGRSYKESVFTELGDVLK